MKNVYLMVGWGASNLGTIDNNDLLWWDPQLSPGKGLGGLRLAPNGKDPQPPDGKQMGVATFPQNPWLGVLLLLRSQLDRSDWRIELGVYDWRFDLLTTARTLADNIRRNSTLNQRATLVGHSAGGLVCLAAYADLVRTNQQDLVRRLITICSPLQGTYLPILWLIGSSGTVRQLLALQQLATWVPLFNPAQWTIDFLNELALTWPSFYELFPFLIGTDAQTDPNRPLLYTAANYPVSILPDQAWLNHSKNVFQPLIHAMNTRPPPWVYSCVVGTGIATPFLLSSAATPLQLGRLGWTTDGDGVVTVISQTRTDGALVTVIGEHNQVPQAIASNGTLAALIGDPRQAPEPPPAPKLELNPIIMNVTDPPQADQVTGLTCIGGG